jgi:hypothetical protein
LLENSVFGPEDIKAMTTAFEDALKTLGVTDRKSPVVEILAKNIIDLARRGERDPTRLREKALGASMD